MVRDQVTVTVTVTVTPDNVDRHQARREEAQCRGLVGRGQDSDQLSTRVLSQHHEEDA